VRVRVCATACVYVTVSTTSKDTKTPQAHRTHVVEASRERQCAWVYDGQARMGDVEVFGIGKFSKKALTVGPELWIRLLFRSWACS